MPFFSVIIPAYNRAELIGAALDSVLNQEFTDFEIIVVDDGSTDNTLEILNGYGSRIKVLQQHNRGPGAARNLGIQHAIGEYIAFLDSDDVWFPWTLSTYMQVIKGCKSPEFIAGTTLYFAEDTELIEPQQALLQVENFSDYYSSMRNPIWVGTCGVAIKADVLRVVGGFTDQWLNAEDSDLWMNLGIARGFIYIQEPPVFGYRQHPNSAVSDVPRTYNGICHLIKKETHGQYPGGTARRLERLTILTRHIRPVSLECLRRGEILKGWKLYLNSFGWHIRLKRFRYLGAFPFLSILHFLKSGMSWRC